MFFALAVGEVGLRLSGYGDRKPREQYVEADGLPPRPRGTRVFQHDTGTRYKYNREGFRGADWVEPKPPGVYRVVMLGDSYVFGIAVSERQTLPVQLQRELQYRHGPGMEVVNLGFYGINTQQEALLARRYFERLQPDLVILVAVTNDADVQPWNPDPVETCDVAVTPLEAVDHFLLRYLYVTRPAHKKWSATRCEGPLRCEASFDPATPQGRCFQASLAAIVRATTRAGAGLLVVHYPLMYPDWGPHERYPDERHARALAEVVRGMRLNFLDLTAIFIGRGGAQLGASHDPLRHPTAATHKLAAQRIAGELSMLWDYAASGTATFSP